MSKKHHQAKITNYTSRKSQPSLIEDSRKRSHSELENQDNFESNEMSNDELPKTGKPFKQKKPKQDTSNMMKETKCSTDENESRDEGKNKPFPKRSSFSKEAEEKSKQGPRFSEQNEVLGPGSEREDDESPPKSEDSEGELKQEHTVSQHDKREDQRRDSDTDSEGELKQGLTISQQDKRGDRGRDSDTEDDESPPKREVSPAVQKGVNYSDSDFQSQDNPEPENDMEEYEELMKESNVDELPSACSENKRCLPPIQSKVVKGITHHLLCQDQSQRRYEWSNYFVRMPCDPENKIVVYTSGVKHLESRWRKIRETLTRRIRDVFTLQASILEYNGHHSKNWNFKCLRHYFLESRYKHEKTDFFNNTLPKIIECALQLDVLFPQSIPLLKKNVEALITMTQWQAACLMANAFLCTFPWRSRGHKQDSILPTINFDVLFNGPVSECRTEKIKCVIHYFNKVLSRKGEDMGKISYRRQVLRKFPEWASSDKQFTKLHAWSRGTIEDDGPGMLQVDFANKYVGGGVIGSGAVQEEIRFLICPEMIISRLFTEVLEDNEVLIMTGCERFSQYRGYSSSFEWVNNYRDMTERDKWDRRVTEVVAMDAIVVKDYGEQFSKMMVERELNKAYCAFVCKEEYEQHVPAVCTGNWGCGAFGGDKELKALIQLIAASEAGRDVVFLTFEDEAFRRELSITHAKIRTSGLPIRDIVCKIEEYNRGRKTTFRKTKLFSSIEDLY